jgi:hypothetical protein
MYPSSMPRHPEDTLLWVQLHPVCPHAIKHDVQIVNQVVRLPDLDDNVIYVCLYGLPDVVPENVLHTSLVRSARVSKVEWHCYVVKHVEWCDERGRELIGLFGGNPNRRQGIIGVHTTQWNLQFDRFVAKEKGTLGHALFKPV